MKIVKCKPGHSLHIAPQANVDPATPIDYLFGHSGIDIFVGHVTEQEVRIALQVPKQFKIVHHKQLT